MVRPAVLADGTYATQTAAVAEEPTMPGMAVPTLRALVLGGDFFLGSVVATTLTKLALRYVSTAPTAGVDAAAVNRLHAETMLYIVCMLRLGKSGGCRRPSMRFGRSTDPVPPTLSGQGVDADVWLRGCADVQVIVDKIKQQEEDARTWTHVAQADDLIDFYHLKSRKGLRVELGSGGGGSQRQPGSTCSGKGERKLNRVLQLTGFSDPVYAEACVTVHQYDIVMDVTVVNRTKEVQQNLYELATMGDLKLVERPQGAPSAPETKHVRANIKVTPRRLA